MDYAQEYDEVAFGPGNDWTVAIMLLAAAVLLLFGR